MVTLKREEQTENRYGGYTTRFSDRMQISDRFTRYAETDLFAEEDVAVSADTEYDNYLWEELKRTAPRRITPQSEFRKSAPVEEKSAPARVKARKRATLSLKGKLLVLLYSAMIVLFSGIIITNAIAIDKQEPALPNLEAEVPGNDSTIQDAYTAGGEVGGETSDQNLPNGTVEGTSSVGYEIIPVVPQANTTINTNWFDQLCDGLSSVFGG